MGTRVKQGGASRYHRGATSGRDCAEWHSHTAIEAQPAGRHGSSRSHWMIAAHDVVGRLEQTDSTLITWPLDPSLLGTGIGACCGRAGRVRSAEVGTAAPLSMPLRQTNRRRFLSSLAGGLGWLGRAIEAAGKSRSVRRARAASLPLPARSNPVLANDGQRGPSPDPG